MNGNVGLDDVTTAALEQELARRRRTLAAGRCPGCGGALATHACRYAGREEDHYGWAVVRGEQGDLFGGAKGGGPYEEGR